VIVHRSVGHPCARLPARLYTADLLFGWTLYRRQANAKLSFHKLLSSTSAQLQLVHRLRPDAANLFEVPLESAIWVRGIVKAKVAAKKKTDGGKPNVAESQADDPVEVEIDVQDWRLLNAATDDLPFKSNDGRYEIVLVRRCIWRRTRSRLRSAYGVIPSSNPAVRRVSRALPLLGPPAQEPG
jgi:aspartyl/asparaginyl-tRNA synthetase